MTVCVGAICEHSGIIVTASDRFVTWGTYSGSEPALKLARIAKRWCVMIAGDNITRGVENVIRNARQTLAAYEDAPIGIDDVRSAVIGAWREARNELAESVVLGPFNLRLAHFLKSGREMFGEAKFSELVEEIRAESKLQCQMLVCGFDDKQVPTLLVCDDDSPCVDFTRADFTAIGNGHTAAISSLAFHGYTREVNLEKAIYQVCAAKFMSERSPGVGKETLVLCLHMDGRTKWIFKRHIQAIRQLWEAEGRPREPPQPMIDQTIGPITKHQEWLDT